MREKQIVGSPFFGAFCSDRFPSATKEVIVHPFILSFNFRDKFIMENALADKRFSKLY